MVKKFFSYLRHIFFQIQDYIDSPFSIDCFGQMNRQLERLPEEERKATIARIRKQIDDLE